MTQTLAPGAIVTRRRSAKTGSSTAFRPSATTRRVERGESGANGLARDPRIFSAHRSVSNSGLPMPSPIGDAEVRGPDLRFARRAFASRRQNRADIGDELGLDKHFGEGGMRDVGVLRPQAQFYVGGDFDLARAGSPR